MAKFSIPPVLRIRRLLASVTAGLAVIFPANLALAATSIPNPTANIAPTYYHTCQLRGDQSQACGTAIVAQINSADKQEGAQEITLPPDYYQLMPAEQVFVITNLNRLAFGLPAIPAMNSDANIYAATGALDATDPNVPGSLSTGQEVLAWDGNWAEDINVLSSDFNWMYNDGRGSFNIDCQTAGALGCWGHRDNILENWNHLLTSAGWSNFSLVAGAAQTGLNGLESVTYDAIATATPAPESFTWRSVLASYASAGTEPVRPFTSSNPALENGALVRISGVSQLFLVEGGTLHPLLSNAIETGIFGTAPTTITTLNAATSYVVGEPAVAPFRAGTLIQASGHRSVYLVINGVLHHVANPATLGALGYTFGQVTHVPSLPDFWPVGATITQNAVPYYNGELLRFQGTASVYVYWNGALHHVISRSQFSQLGLKWTWVANLPHGIGSTSVGAPVSLPNSWIADGTLIQVHGQNPVYLVANGELHHVASLSAFHGLAANWSEVLEISSLPSLANGTPIN
ncbi:hypothetical protein [Sulfobacillus harzensis]|uniref:Uncharacterized protein n=1 Tax=Sulfobacillus harzensis TaxID=2729629 RepID=A0A7Y0L4H6_9FIRM|nr:hypothetical protein [Sulfobacillus harzensis]NMP23153.1 hypothetical protein [Sulfobacillus harzensis]